MSQFFSQKEVVRSAFAALFFTLSIKVLQTLLNLNQSLRESLIQQDYSQRGLADGYTYLSLFI